MCRRKIGRTSPVGCENMVNLEFVERKSAVLTPSSLVCLSKTATINLTSGCDHGCVYCYTKGYSYSPANRPSDFTKTLPRNSIRNLLKNVSLGDEPRRIFDELGDIRLVDVVLPMRKGPAIRRRCVPEPTEHQKILLQRLGLNLPKQFKNNF